MLSLEVVLTYGWPIPEPDKSASKIHWDSLISQKSYQDVLSERLKSGDCIHGLEELFRRRVGGYNDFKQFLAELAIFSNKQGHAFTCYMDAFAYAFLKVKNVDFLLPEKEHGPLACNDTCPSNCFRSITSIWAEHIQEVDELEELGTYPTKRGLIELYLRMREIIGRPSARDERRALATLLVSGPSTMKEISEDLGLNYSLSQRTISAFVTLGAVEKDDERTKRGEHTVFKLSRRWLPITLYCIRSAYGLDFLAALTPVSELA